MTQQEINARIDEQQSIILEKNTLIEKGNTTVVHAAELALIALVQNNTITADHLGGAAALQALVSLVQQRNGYRSAIAQAEAEIAQLEAEEAEDAEGAENEGGVEAEQ